MWDHKSYVWALFAGLVMSSLFVTLIKLGAL